MGSMPNPLEVTAVEQTHRIRDEAGMMSLKLGAAVVSSALFLGGGIIAGANSLLDPQLSFEHERTLSPGYVHGKVDSISVGGADYCPLTYSANIDDRTDFKSQTKVHVGILGHGGTIPGPTSKWWSVMHGKFGATTCINPVTAQTVRVDKKDVYITLTNPQFTVQVSEIDPQATTFTHDANFFGKLPIINNAMLKLIPETGFLHPDSIDNIYVLEDGENRQRAADLMVSDCAPQVEAKVETSIEAQAEHDAAALLGIPTERVHVDITGTPMFVNKFNTNKQDVERLKDAGITFEDPKLTAQDCEITAAPVTKAVS